MLFNFFFFLNCDHKKCFLIEAAGDIHSSRKFHVLDATENSRNSRKARPEQVPASLQCIKIIQNSHCQSWQPRITRRGYTLETAGASSTRPTVRWEMGTFKPSQQPSATGTAAHVDWASAQLWCGAKVRTAMICAGPKLLLLHWQSPNVPKETESTQTCQRTIETMTSP